MTTVKCTIYSSYTLPEDRGLAVLELEKTPAFCNRVSEVYDDIPFQHEGVTYYVVCVDVLTEDIIGDGKRWQAYLGTVIPSTTSEIDSRCTSDYTVFS